MAWQDMSPFPTPRMDAEEEREMRLAAQARAGAEWALAALIARYQPPVLRYLTRLMGDPAQAHSLAERIFVRMERRLRGPRGGEHLRLWLLRAATEAGLDVLRHPTRSRQPSRLSAPDAPRGLLTDGPAGAADRLRAGLSKIAEITGTTRRQVRQLIWNNDEPVAPKARIRSQSAGSTATIPPVIDPELDTMNPQEELRHRLVRAVLAELPYGDAQCLALHLVAGLNQTEVARALGIRPSAARRRIVQGLQMFSHRYDAAITSLGVPSEIAYAEPAESSLLASTNTIDALDTVAARDERYPAYPSPARPRVETPAYQDYRDDEAATAPAARAASDEVVRTVAHDIPNMPGGADTDSGMESAAYSAIYPESGDQYGEYDQYDDSYGRDQVISAPIVVAPVNEAPASAQPVIVDALPAIPTPVAEQAPAGIVDEAPEGSWLDQPTMVPVLSHGAPDERAEQAPQDTVSATADVAPRKPVDSAPRVPVVTPPNTP